MKHIKRFNEELNTETYMGAYIGEEFMGGKIQEINIINNKKFEIDILEPEKIKKHYYTNKRIKMHQTTFQDIKTLNVKLKKDSIYIDLTVIAKDDDPEEGGDGWIEENYDVKSLTKKDANLIVKIVNDLTNEIFVIGDIESGDDFSII